MSNYDFDIVCMGRSSIDLYSNDIGKPFEEISTFTAFVGGCPTNISVGTRRLGLKSALLTGFGYDPVGDFLVRFLEEEGVDTRFSVRKEGRRSSAVLLGIQPPDKFPLVYYRDNCADIALDIGDVDQIPFDRTRALLISGTGLSKEPSLTATICAAEKAHEAGTDVILDIDFRPDQWPGLREFGTTVRSVLPYVKILIGTTEEVKAAAFSGEGEAVVSSSQVSDAHVDADLDASIERMMGRGVEVLALKSGEEGCRMYQKGEKDSMPVPGFSVEVVNILGAGDAFASGLIKGYLSGWDWYKSARLGNACGAIVVTRQGCANFMPTFEEAVAFANEQGGLSR